MWTLVEGFRSTYLLCEVYLFCSEAKRIHGSEEVDSLLMGCRACQDYPLDLRPVQHQQFKADEHREEVVGVAFRKWWSAASALSLAQETI